MGLGVEGLERSGVSVCDCNDLANSPKIRVAKCDARPAALVEIDPKLARILTAWPQFSEKKNKVMLQEQEAIGVRLSV